MENVIEIPQVKFNLALNKPNFDIDILALDEFYQRFSTLQQSPRVPHRIEFHCILYIIEGTGTHFIDFVDYEYAPGTCIFINQHQVHAFNFKSPPKGYFILFTDTFLDGVRSNIRTPLFTSTSLFTATSPVLRLENALERSCYALMADIDNELCRSDSNSLLIQMLFSSLLLKLNRERVAEKPSLSERRIAQFNQFIQRVEVHFTLSRDASYYANLMHMTYKSLNQLCKQVSGQTAKQIIDAHTILEAKRKLAVEQIQVQQLAFSLGFDEVTNFIKYFKRHTSQTPAQFKAHINVL